MHKQSFIGDISTKPSKDLGDFVVLLISVDIDILVIELMCVSANGGGNMFVDYLSVKDLTLKGIFIKRCQQGC